LVPKTSFAGEDAFAGMAAADLEGISFLPALPAIVDMLQQKFGIMSKVKAEQVK
jgi:hypothetical protein